MSTIADQSAGISDRDLRPILDPSDVCELLRWSKRTLEKKVAAEQFPAPDLAPGGRHRWYRGTVKRWLEGQELK